jgi:hypothetical protein
VLGGQEASWPLAIFAASATALLVPAHVEIALLGLVGVGVVWAFRTAQSLAGTRRLPAVAPMWRRTIIATAILTVATVIWGFLTAHGTVSTGATPGVTPFNASWSESVAIIAVGAGAFLTIPIAWIMTRKEASIPADLYLGTAAILVAGIVIWGALLANIFTFHVFFAGIAVFATPVAAVAAWAVWSRLSATGHRRVAIGVLVLCCLQLEGGVALSIIRLQGFGPGLYPPVPVSILNAIEDLPPDAKLAYACHPLEEVAFWNSGLQGVGTHAGRPIVPMCFQAEAFGPLIGVPVSAEAMSPRFLLAPQRSLYPTATAKPSSESVSSFLREHGIAYIYTDAIHPNTLVPGAVRIATSGETAILRLP